MRIPLFLVAICAAAGCGGESTAELNLFDAPPSGVTSVKVWVASMQVHVVPAAEARDADPNDASIDDDSSWRSLVVDRQIDLVQRQGETAAEKLGELPLPEGKITQLRLLLDTEKGNTATDASGTCDLILDKGVIRKGVKINHVFRAFESRSGARVQVWTDFRLEDSLKTKDACYELKPVLKLHRVRLDGQDQTL